MSELQSKCAADLKKQLEAKNTEKNEQYEKKIGNFLLMALNLLACFACFLFWTPQLISVSNCGIKTKPSVSRSLIYPYALKLWF